MNIWNNKENANILEIDDEGLYENKPKVQEVDEDNTPQFVSLVVKPLKEFDKENTQLPSLVSFYLILGPRNRSFSFNRLFSSLERC